jgi:hypothetical protein
VKVLKKKIFNKMKIGSNEAKNPVRGFFFCGSSLFLIPGSFTMKT